MASTAMMKVFHFNAISLSFCERDGEWWLSAREVASALGYSGPDEVAKLYRRNAANFKAGESATVRLTGPDGKTYAQRAFSPRGLLRVAIHAGTPSAVEFHDFVVDLIEKLRTGERAVVDPVALMAKVAELEARLVEASQAQAFAANRALDNVCAITKDAFSAIASALAKRGALKKAEKKLLAEMKEGQKFLPGLGGSPVNRLPQN